jgi:hypothetical protein
MASYVKYGYVQKREHKNPKLCSMFPIPHEERFPIVKRMFQLTLQGNSTPAISNLMCQEFPDHKRSFGITLIDKRLRDSFYCGLWVIKKGTKEERIIDLTQITLNDGTRFEPVISKQDFDAVQSIRSANRCGAAVRRKHVNPLPQMVTC